MAKVTIIIPTYNRAHFLRDAMRSALDHELTQFELVIVDDGSTDNTRQVVSEFDDNRIRYIFQQNRGATAAFNTGLRFATGEYIGILGSDDAYIPGGISSLARKLDHAPDTGLVSGGFIYVDAAGKEIQPANLWEMYPKLDVKTWLYWCPLYLQSALIRRDWIERVGLFNEDIQCSQDWEYGLRLAQAGCRMSWIERPIFYYRMHGGQSVKKSEIVRQDWIRALDQFFQRSDIDPDLLAMKDRVYAHAYLKRAITAFEARLGAEGRLDLEYATRFDKDVLHDEGQRLFDMLTGWAVSPFTSESTAFLNTAFDSLPESLSALRRRRSQALASVAMAQFFAAHQKGDARTVRRMFLSGVRQDVSWLQNRGVLIIAADAFLGLRIGTTRRRAMGRLLHGKP